MVKKVCSRSHGQPPGARRRFMILTDSAKSWAGLVPSARCGAVSVGAASLSAGIALTLQRPTGGLVGFEPRMLGRSLRRYPGRRPRNFGTGGWRSGLADCDVRSAAGTGIRQLPERVHLAAAAPRIDRSAGIAVSKVPECNSGLGQRAGLELDVPAWALPGLPMADSLAVSGSGSGDGRAISAVFSAVWTDYFECRGGSVLFPDARTGGHGCRDHATAQRVHLAGDRAGGGFCRNHWRRDCGPARSWISCVWEHWNGVGSM